MEQEARRQGVESLVLLTTRTADWFEQRDFKWQGPAYASTLLPESRRCVRGRAVGDGGSE